MKKVSVTGKVLSDYFKIDARFIFLVSSFAFGYVCGVLLFRLDLPFVCEYSTVTAASLVGDMTSYSIWLIWLKLIVYMLPGYFFSLLLGLFVPGEILSFIYIAAEGIRLGGLFSAFYSSMGVKGALLSFSVLFIPAITYALGLAFAFRSTVKFSVALLMQFLGRKCDNLLYDYKSFLLRSVIFFVIIILSAWCGALLYKCFISAFI